MYRDTSDLPPRKKIDMKNKEHRMLSKAFETLAVITGAMTMSSTRFGHVQACRKRIRRVLEA